MQEAVRGHRITVWRGEYVLIFLLHAFENLNRIRSDRNVAVEVFRFQRGLAGFLFLCAILIPLLSPFTEKPGISLPSHS